MDEEHMLDMYDEAISAAEELTGEETDCITAAAFAMMATARGLLPPMATRFVEPLSAAAELKHAREASNVDVIGSGGGAAKPSMARGATFRDPKRKEGGVMTRSATFGGTGLGSPGSPPMLKAQSTSAAVVKAAAKSKSGVGLGRSKTGGVKRADGAGGTDTPKTEEQLELLRTAMSSNFLFRGLDAEQLTRIMQAMMRIEVPKGREVIKQGDKGDLFYVAERGEFEVFVAEPGQLAEAGKLIHTYVASPDEGRFPCFGELALMYAKPRQASVVASSDGVLWGLNRANFRRASNKGNDMLKVLRSVAVFASLRIDQLQDLRDAMTERRCERDETIVAQGEPADGMYVISQGSCSVQIRSAGEARPVELMVLGEAQYFGEASILDGAPRSADVVALSDDVVLMKLARADFERLLGPLQEMLDADRRARAQREERRLASLEDEGLKNVRRSTIAVQARAAEGLYLCQHASTAREYTLLVESKAALLGREAAARTRERLAVLHELHACEAKHVAKALRTFHDEANLYTLLRGRAVCYLPELDGYAKETGHEMLWTPRVGRSVTTDSRSFVVGCLALGLAELHEQGVLYRGLSEPAATLDARGYVQLANFRYARRLPQDGEAFTLCGAPDYMAPEVVRGSGHGVASDWWSLGVAVHVMMTGASPWHLRLAAQQNEMLTYQRITSHAADAIRLRGVRSAIEQSQNLINELLTPDPAERLGARGGSAAGLAELQAHPFFEGLDWHALADGKLASPIAPISETRVQQLVPAKGSGLLGQSNPEEGIETEACPEEVLLEEGESDRFQDI